MASSLEKRVAHRNDPQSASWNGEQKCPEVPAVPEDKAGNRSAYPLASKFSIQPVKSPSTPSAYAQSVGLTDTVVLREVVHVIDDFGLKEFLIVAAEYGRERFGYVVTPNVDHLIRYYEDANFQAQYRAADFILMDS